MPCTYDLCWLYWIFNETLSHLNTDDSEMRLHHVLQFSILFQKFSSFFHTLTDIYAHANKVICIKSDWVEKTNACVLLWYKIYTNMYISQSCLRFRNDVSIANCLGYPCHGSINYALIVILMVFFTNHCPHEREKGFWNIHINFVLTSPFKHLKQFSGSYIVHKNI